jgi:leukotriene-A4 hydrolase
MAGLPPQCLPSMHAHPVRTFYSTQVKTIGANHPFTRLVPDLSNGGDPDDAFSRIPYECD